MNWFCSIIDLELVVLIPSAALHLSMHIMLMMIIYIIVHPFIPKANKPIRLISCIIKQRREWNTWL